jgi:23S rRNA (pseudouridine1915-N3)-methyltransferase
VRIFLYFIGRPKNRHANALAEDYIARAAKYTPCEMREIRPERFDPWTKHASAAKVLLDPAGRAFDSDAFSAYIGRAEMEARDLVFVVGGADGLPPAWTQRADLLLSLSSMTLPHELARAMVAEQIYRAFAILRGHPYPR